MSAQDGDKHNGDKFRLCISIPHLSEPPFSMPEGARNACPELFERWDQVGLECEGGSSFRGTQNIMGSTSNYYVYNDLGVAISVLRDVLTNFDYPQGTKVDHVTFHADFTTTRYNMIERGRDGIEFFTEELAEAKLLYERE